MKNTENSKYIKLGLTGAAVAAFGIWFCFMIFKGHGLATGVRVVLGILRPFVIGAVIAYLITPMARGLEKVFGKRAAKLANVLALIIALVIVSAIVLLIVPQLIISIIGIVQALPSQLEAWQQNITTLLEKIPVLQEIWTKVSGYFVAEGEKILAEYSEGNMNGELMNTALSILGGAASGVLDLAGVLADLFIGLIVTLYLLFNRTKLAAQAKLIAQGLLKPEWADWLESEVRYADRVFNGFFIGKLIDSTIVGVICYIFCRAMGFASPLLIAVIIGVTNIIPFFGPFIGALPCALLLLLSNPFHSLIFLIFIFVLQQIDGNIIGPRILGDTTGLSPLWVTFAILLFGGLWGLLGMLIGVPLMAVIYDVIRQITFSGVRRHGRDKLIDEYKAEFHPNVRKK